MNTLIMIIVLMAAGGGSSLPWPASDAAIASPVPPTLERQQQQESKPVDINKATVEQLQEVPGIGPALAQRIVEFRKEHGPFEKIDDLLNVRGIGTTTLDKLKPYLTIEKTK